MSNSNAKNLKIKRSDTKRISYEELSLIKNMIFWVDILPDEKTHKNAIFARPFNDKNAIPQKLTGDNFYIKSNFHGYGGKSYQCIEVNDQIYLIWVDQLSRADRSILNKFDHIPRYIDMTSPHNHENCF